MSARGLSGRASGNGNRNMKSYLRIGVWAGNVSSQVTGRSCKSYWPYLSICHRGTLNFTVLFEPLISYHVERESDKEVNAADGVEGPG